MVLRAAKAPWIPPKEGFDKAKRPTDPSHLELPEVSEETQARFADW